jgi:hypothetical protein
MVVKRGTPRRGQDGVRDRAIVGARIRREPPLALFAAQDLAMADTPILPGRRLQRVGDG